MGFFSDPYGISQLQDMMAKNPVMQKMLEQAASGKYTGTINYPGGQYQFENGNIVAEKPWKGGWKKFGLTAAALVGGGIAAGGGLAGAAPGASGAFPAGTGSVATGTTAADAAASGVLPSTGSIGTSVLPAGGTGLSGAKVGGNLMSKLVGKDSTGLGDLGKTLGSFADTEAQNRSTTGDFMQGYDRLRLDAQQDQRAQEADAMKKLHQSGYILGGGSKYGAPVQLNSGNMPIMPNGPMAPTDAMKSGASTLQDQMLKRLGPGGSYMPTDPTTYTKPGKAENVAKWGGLASSAGNFIKNLF